MKKLSFAVFSLALIAFPTFAQSGGVAVLDIDEVARQLGVEKKVQVDLLDIQNNMNTELKTTQETLQKQMTDVEQSAGQNPTDEKKREIVATNQQLNEEFNRLRNQAQAQLNQERVRMINEFRIRLEPIALKAAQAKGLDVVLMKVTPPIFTSAANVDITQETTRLALEAGMQVKASELEAPAAAPATTTPTAAPATSAPISGAEKAKSEAPAKGKGKGE